MAITTIFLYFLGLATFLGAMGAVFFRHYVYATLAFLLVLLSVSGFFYLLGAKILATFMFWYLGSTAAMVLLHTYFLIGFENIDKTPRRLVPGKFIFVTAFLYLAFMISIVIGQFKNIKPAYFNVNLKNLMHFANGEYSFALFLLLLVAPFIFISCLMLIRQNSKKPDGQ